MWCVAEAARTGMCMWVYRVYEFVSRVSGRYPAGKLAHGANLARGKFELDLLTGYWSFFFTPALLISLCFSFLPIPHCSIDLVTRLVVVISTCLFHLMNQAWL